MNRLIRSLPLVSLVLLTTSGVKALDISSDLRQQQVKIERSALSSSTLLAQTAIPQQSFIAANQLRVTVKEIAPYSQETDLQIVCLFKHRANGDTLISAAADLDNDLGGLVTSLRDRGEFIGDELETLLIVPPQNSIKPKSLLLIGLGEEQNLSLETMQRIGTVALREATRLRAAHVSFAPILRDQSNSTLDTGDVAQAVIQNVILAYDTEKRLQQQGLAQPFTIDEWVYEAGTAFFAGAISNVQAAVELTNTQIANRSSTPYISGR